VGNFDGNHFTPEMEPQKGHFGPHFYAAQIFNLAPEDRKIMIGWLRGAAFPGMPFSQGMTVPLELALGSTPQGFRLCFSPVPEIRGLYQLTQGIQGISIAQANEFFAGASAELMDIRLQLIPDSSKSFILHLYGQQIQYNPAAGCLICLGQEASVLLYNGLLDLRILVDRSVMEVFAGKGEAAFAGMALFDRSSAGIFLEGEGKIGKLTIHALKSMWG
jgi:sucrose-6-phosphate hydrolase SacC (GH32 family)